MKHSKKPYFVGELMPGLPIQDPEQKNGTGDGKTKETAVKGKSPSRREVGGGSGEISEAERDYYLFMGH